MQVCLTDDSLGPTYNIFHLWYIVVGEVTVTPLQSYITSYVL
jgi:hypothetical protein